MGILYYLPGRHNHVTRAQMIDAGLSHALDESAPGDPSVTPVRSGPDGGEGAIVVPPSPPGVPVALGVYQPTAQRWRAGPGKRWWCGCDAVCPPGPNELRRGRRYPGTAVRLRDGREWVVPRCCPSLDHDPTLPTSLDLDDDGNVVTRPHERYLALAQHAERGFWSYVGRDPAMSADEMVTLSVDAMAVNYRVGRVEVIGLLRLWGTDEYRDVYRATFDADHVDEAFTEFAAGDAEKHPDARPAEVPAVAGGPADEPPADVRRPGEVAA